MADEREEKEIVDEISSDEELCMRQRILELEAKNDELEQIARISGSAANEYISDYFSRNATTTTVSSNFNEPVSPQHGHSWATQRAGQVPTDASSISSVEFSAPKKQKRRKKKGSKSKKYDRKSCRRYHNRGHRPSHDYVKKKRRQIDQRIIIQAEFETISLDSYESMDDERVEDKSLYLSRDELRLMRNTKKDFCSTGSLKERLLKEKNNICDKRSITNKEPIEIVSDKKEDIEEAISDNSSSLEEQELRLIALKSAIMKKHFARKKRNAELAYSPTDFEDMLVGTYDNMDIVDVELDDLQGDMEISPVNSPKLLLSPVQFIEEQSNSASMDVIGNKCAVDTKPIDMDIVNSESEEETFMNMPEISKCSQIENIPLPTGMCLPEFDLPMPFNSLEYATQVPYGIYIPEASYEPPPISVVVPPPLPPAVVQDSPPPPPSFIMQSDDNFHCHTTHEQNFYCMKYTGCNEKETFGTIRPDVKADETRVQTDIQRKSIVNILENTIPEAELISLENSQDSSRYHNENSLKKNEEDEGEEESLRSLLLSQYQSLKNYKKKPNQLKAQHFASPVKTNFSQETDDGDADTLRSLLLTNLPDQKIRKTPTESILKEAVRRFKIKEHITNNTLHLESISEEQSACDKNNQQSLIRSSSPFNQNFLINAIDEENVENAIILNHKGIPLANYVKFDDSMHRKMGSETSEVNCKNSKVDVKSVESINEVYFGEMKEQINSNTFNMNNIEINEFNYKLGNFVEQKDKLIYSRNEAIDDTLRAKTQEKAENKKPTTESKVLVEKVGTNALLAPHQQIKEKDSEEITLLHPTDIHSELVKNCSPVSNEVVATITTDLSEKDITKVPLNASEETKFTSAAIIPNLKTADESKITKIISPIIENNMKTSSTHTELVKLYDVSSTTKTSTSETLTKRSFASVATAPSDTIHSLKPTSNVSSFAAYKIVKPNKVINKNQDLKRKPADTNDHQSRKKLEKTNIDHLQHSTASNSSTNSTPMSSRLVTSVDLKNLKVDKLVITLLPTESDCQNSSDEESWNENSMAVTSTALERCKTPESVGKMNNIRYDNTSPISLQMDSGGTTPTRSKSPNAIELSEICAADIFEQKLENFLRNARSKVQQTAATQSNATVTEMESNTPATTGSYSTPVAVRHLPTTAQQEYRRLVHRMNMLEKQKQLKCNASDTSKNTSKLRLNHNSSPLQEIEAKTAKKSSLTPVQQDLCRKKIIPRPSQSPGCKDVLIRKVLVKNAVNKKITAAKTAPSSPAEKANVLRAYESLFLKISTDIISNLDKSLQLVEEAKRTKLAKLNYEQRVKELRFEMEQAQDKLKQEQQKMSNIYPKITKSNNDITSLTQKRVKLFKAANNLGKIVQGEEYRLNNDLKTEITIKSKKLATDIKLVNSLTHCDLEETENSVEAKTCVQSVTTINQNVEIKESDLESVQPMGTPALVNSKDMKLDAGLSNNEGISAHDIADVKSLLGDNCKGIIAKVQTEDLLVSNNELDVTLNEVTETAKEVLEETHSEQTFKRDNEDQQEECKIINETTELTEETKALHEYISPLTHLRHFDSRLDPNGVICPYDLMGRCEDKDCKYMHLTEQNLNSV